jgi:hypothetical protein
VRRRIEVVLSRFVDDADEALLGTAWVRQTLVQLAKL